jgi:hypothetical protein
MRIKLSDISLRISKDYAISPYQRETVSARSSDTLKNPINLCLLYFTLIIGKQVSHDLRLRFQLLDPLPLESPLGHKPRVSRYEANGSEQDKDLQSKKLKEERLIFHGVLMQ